MSDFKAGLASIIRTIALAEPGKRWAVFKNAAREAASLVSKGGISRQVFADELHNAAVAHGLVESEGEDAIQAMLSEALDHPLNLSTRRSKKAAGEAAALNGRASLAATQAPRFTPIAIDDVEPSAEPAWAIHRLLPARGLANTYGPPKSRKSFLMTDALFHIARGVTYAGRDVLPGPVFYCTGEGVSGFKRRLVALRQHHEVEGHRIPFFMVPNVPDLGSERTNLGELFTAIDRCLAEHQLPGPRAVGLDTVARCMGAGDENIARDMGRLIDRCGEIERRYRCLVQLIHHTGKDATLGSRGSNALNGAADVTWKVERSDAFSRVTVEEMKDGPSGASWTFRLIPVELRATKSATIENEANPVDLGSETESCVVELLSNPELATKSATKPRHRPTGLAGDLFKVIQSALDQAGEINGGSVSAPSGARTISRDMLKNYCVSMAWQDPEGTPHSFRTMLAKYLSALRAKDLVRFDRQSVWVT